MNRLQLAVIAYLLENSFEMLLDKQRGQIKSATYKKGGKIISISDDNIEVTYDRLYVTSTKLERILGNGEMLLKYFIEN